MIEEICSITDEGKAAKNEWVNVDSNFLQSLYTVHIKNLDNSFSILYLLTCLTEIHHPVNKYFNKLISKV